MKKTILITGSSSGIGKSTVIEFAKNGWNVIATQRNPEKESDFKTFNNVKLYPLDVTNLDSISKVFQKVVEEFGTIDVVAKQPNYFLYGSFNGKSRSWNVLNNSLYLSSLIL